MISFLARESKVSVVSWDRNFPAGDGAWAALNISDGRLKLCSDCAYSTLVVVLLSCKLYELIEIEWVLSNSFCDKLLKSKLASLILVEKVCATHSFEGVFVAVISGDSKLLIQDKLCYHICGICFPNSILFQVPS